MPASAALDIHVTVAIFVAFMARCRAHWSRHGILTTSHRYPSTAYRCDQRIQQSIRLYLGPHLRECRAPQPGQHRMYRLNDHTRTLRGSQGPLHDIEACEITSYRHTTRPTEPAANIEHQDLDMKLATSIAHGAQGSPGLQRWSSIIHLVINCFIDFYGIQEYDPGFRLPEAATTALHNDYKFYTVPGTGLRVAFVAKTHWPHTYRRSYTPHGLAAALRFLLPHGARRTIMCVYSNFIPRDKRN